MNSSIGGKTNREGGDAKKKAITLIIEGEVNSVDELLTDISCIAGNK